MVVEIEKTSVSFTDEAEIALSRLVSRLERRLRASAADLAINARGTPAEVTGSDVERAYREVLRPNAALFEEKLQYERRVRKSHMLHLVSTFYAWLGLLTALGGVLYPYIHERLSNPTFRLSLTVTITGIALAAASFALREYWRQRELFRRTDLLRRYSHSVGSQEESD